VQLSVSLLQSRPCIWTNSTNAPSPPAAAPPLTVPFTSMSTRGWKAGEECQGRCVSCSTPGPSFKPPP
jgi:hypothetical protein